MYYKMFSVTLHYMLIFCQHILRHTMLGFWLQEAESVVFKPRMELHTTDCQHMR